MKGLIYPLFAIFTIALAVFVIWALYLEYRKKVWAHAESTAQWEPHHYSDKGAIYVVVRKVARLSSGQLRELEPPVAVTTIQSADPDWNERLIEARRVAYERAFELNCTM